MPPGTCAPTESLQDSMERAPRHAVYRAMRERGEGEGRVVLTRDRTYVAANYCDQARGPPRGAPRTAALSSHCRPAADCLAVTGGICGPRCSWSLPCLCSPAIRLPVALLPLWQAFLVWAARLLSVPVN